MKRGVLILSLVFLMSFAVALPCDLEVTLLNQDPYPSVPGDYVKLVFQIEGVENPECSDIRFELLEDYPIAFDPGKTGLREFKKVDYIKDYESSLLIPYEVRINENALDGANPIDVNLINKGQATISQTFEIEVDDVRADFEVYIKNYNYATKELTLEVLNIESSDIEALTIEIPKQNKIDVKGSNRVIVGDLDSNEYTTADFEAIMQDGEFRVILIYSDAINERRVVEKTVSFDSSYFKDRVADQKTTSPITYVVLIVIILLAVWFIIKKFKKKK